MMHPTESVYIDSLFGRLEGQAAIRTWLIDIMAKVGNIAFEPIADSLWDGNTSVQLWKQVAVLDDGSKVEMTWGASVRRYRDGWIVWAADYFDAFAMIRPQVVEAGAAIGATVSEADVQRYRGA